MTWGLLIETIHREMSYVCVWLQAVPLTSNRSPFSFCMFIVLWKCSVRSSALAATVLPRTKTTIGKRMLCPSCEIVQKQLTAVPIWSSRLTGVRNKLSTRLSLESVQKTSRSVCASNLSSGLFSFDFRALSRLFCLSQRRDRNQIHHNHNLWWLPRASKKLPLH